MISFFFATMVVLTMNASSSLAQHNNIVSIDELVPITENGSLVGYRYGGVNDEYDNYNNDIWSANSNNNTMSYYLNIGDYQLGYQFETSVFNYGTSQAAVDFKVKVLGESVSTNIFLTNCRIYYIGGNGYNFISMPDIYFKGQSTYYVDGEDGNFTFDLSSYSFGTLYIEYEIRCYSILDDQTIWYNNGYNDGYSAGNEVGLSDGYNNGYSAGYNDGYQQGYSTDSTVTSIFSGILQVALVPINFFLAIFNFEILGINISGFIKALFTIAITIIVIRTIFGGKGAGDGGD